MVSKDIKDVDMLLWLDANHDHTENKNVQSKMRTITTDFLPLNNVSDCENYVRKRPENDRLVLVVSGRLGQTIVPSIHDLPQIIAIYVYCGNKALNEPWAREFAKVG